MASLDNFVENPLMKEMGYTSEGDFYADYVGIPFGGPPELNGGDLEGEHFDKTTNIGPLNEVLFTFDHGKNPFIGPDTVGTAFKKSVEEEGVIYRLIVDRRKKWHKLIEKVVRDNLVGASTTPHQNSARLNKATGLWENWLVGEVTLTPMNAHPDAALIIQKSIEEEELAMAKQTAEAEEKVVQTEATEETVVVAKPETVETPAESLSAQLEKAFKEPVVEETPDAPEGNVIISQDAYNKLMTEVAGARADNVVIQKSLSDITIALPTLAKLIAAQMRGAVVEESKKSVVEKAAERIVQQDQRRVVNSKLPANAPGNH